MKKIGIDEAGRGPVIGPMVMCGVLVNEEVEKKLEKIGVKDSKKILPNTRKKMIEQIKNIVLDYEIIRLSPKEIDKILNSPNSNLNWLEADTTAKIINKLIERNLNVDVIYVDCPSNNIEKYKNYLRERMIGFKGKLVVEHKADEKYISSSAASIIAKVMRDEEIEKIKKRIGIDFGSGYPSDPKTIEFLKKNWNNPKFSEIFRKTWASWKKHKKQNTNKEKQAKLKF